MSATATATAADTAAGSSVVINNNNISDAIGSKDLMNAQEDEGVPATTTATALLEEINMNILSTTTTADATTGENTALSRVVRLEQNRKAASESRKRKRILLDELQRSVIFFTRANDTLKQQNHNLQKLLQQAQNQIKIVDNKNNKDAKTNDETVANPSEESTNDSNNDDKNKVHLPIVIPPAPMTPQMSNFLNTVETGATIQAMTNFQQAASAAMKAALLHMQQQYNNSNDGNDPNGNNGMQQQHQSLFEIATLTLPTTTSPTKATTVAMNEENFSQV